MRICIADTLFYLAAAVFFGLIFLPLDSETLRFGFITTPWIFVGVSALLFVASVAGLVFGDPYIDITGRTDSSKENDSP